MGGCIGVSSHVAVGTDVHQGLDAPSGCLVAAPALQHLRGGGLINSSLLVSAQWQGGFPRTAGLRGGTGDLAGSAAGMVREEAATPALNAQCFPLQGRASRIARVSASGSPSYMAGR